MKARATEQLDLRPGEARLVFTREASRAVDRAAIEEFDLPGILLMENAARGVAAIARRMLGGGEGSRVGIVCGGGNNGGDGYATARHLFNAGVEVTLYPAVPAQAPGDAAVNACVCEKMGIPTRAPGALAEGPPPDLLIDAMFGTGLDRPVRAEAAALIETMNSSPAPILAVDVPSGLDCDTGRPLGTAVKATRTASFLGPKKGFAAPGAEAYTGAVETVDLGVPFQLLARFGERAGERAD